MLILLRSITNEHQFFAEKHNFSKNISQFSDSMSGRKLLNVTPGWRRNILAAQHLRLAAFFVQRAEIATATVLQQILT